MKQWYFVLNDFKAEAGFEFSFVGQGSKGEQYVHLCRITEVVPFRKLQYTWKYADLEGSSLVTFELFEENGGTLVKLTHAGLETFQTVNKDFGRDSFHTGWTELITKLLPAFVEK